MKFRRRHFIQWGLAQVAAATALSSKRTLASEVQPPVRRGLSIMQGATDETTAQFSILHHRGQSLQFYIKNTENTQIFPVTITEVRFPDHAYQLTKLTVQGLRADESYSLSVIDQNLSQVIDTREFRTLNVDREDLSFALCSCMADDKHSPVIWKTMMSQRPDVLVFVGDSVYANRDAKDGMADAAHLWKTFCQARLTLEVYYLPQLVPIIATWDDHDFGMNNGDGQVYPYVKEAQKNFLQFFAQEPGICRNMIAGPGVSSAWRFGSQLFFLMDNRSFREPSESQNRYAHWGREQEYWLLGLLRSHSGPAFICSGSVFFLEMMFVESLSKNHPGQFSGLMAELKALQSKVVFVSGDVHFSEISQIESSHLGYQTYELTSSSIHSVVIPGILNLVSNPRRIAATSQRNFILLQPKAKGFGCEFSATSYGKNGEILFKKQLEV